MGNRETYIELQGLWKMGWQEHEDPSEKEIADLYKCEECGEQIDYHGLRRGEVHRSFAACEECEIAIEF